MNTMKGAVKGAVWDTLRSAEWGLAHTRTHTHAHTRTRTHTHTHKHTHRLHHLILAEYTEQEQVRFCKCGCADILATSNKQQNRPACTPYCLV